MAIRIGIPRGLWFYDYYPLWKKFYEELGAEVILSRATNKEILNNGVKNIVDETCYPVKIFNGHVMDLIGRVDYIFAPKMMSAYESEYICPKFCGLPETLRHSIKDIPPLIDVEINFNKSRNSLNDTIYKFGAYITKDRSKIKSAYSEAIKEYRKYKSIISQGYLPIDGNLINCSLSEDHTEDVKKIMVVGHTYNIYDSYASMNLIKKLKESHVNVLIPEMIDYHVINKYASELDKRMFWTFGRKLLGTSMYLSDSKDVDGVIYLSSFGCGIDSIIQDLFERKSRREGNIPFLLLTIDEHTGEAGINTRIEAFLDMIEWRRINEDNLPAHG